MEHRELVVLGAGPAGLTAGIYAKRSGLDVLVIEKGAVGGQITTTSDVENWPGIKQISGFDLARSLEEHAAHFETEVRLADIQSLAVSDDKKIITTDKGSISADAVIICTGARHKRLGVPGEEELAGRGVSYCAVCDGPFYRNEDVVVVGGGDTAVEEASYLTRFVKTVHLVHRRDTFRAADIIVRRALANQKIVPVWNSVVEKINGETGVASVTLRDVKTGAVSEVHATGVFIFVGTEPNVEALQGCGLAMTPQGWLRADQATLAMNVPGVFAAGDVRETSLRQIVTAAADGARAAMAAYGWLAKYKE